MPTVGSLSYSIVAQSDKLTAGVTASRKELRQLKDTFLATQTPVERFSMAIGELERLAEKFPQKAGGIHRTIAAMRDESFKAAQTPLPESTRMLSVQMSKLQLVIDPVSLAFQALNKATELAHFAFDKLQDVVAAVGERMQRLDEIAKRAKLLGVAEESLVGLAAAAQDLAGISGDQFDRGLLEFTKGIAEAAMSGKGDAAAAFDRLGLSIEELSRLSPDQALLRTADALSKVQNAAERLKLADALVGGKNAPLATMLAAGADQIERIAARANELQQTRFINFDDIERANDAMGQFRMLTDGVLNLLASEMAPLVRDVTNDLTNGLHKAGEEGNRLRDTIQNITNNIAAMVDTVEMAGSALAKMFPGQNKDNVTLNPIANTMELLRNIARGDPMSRVSQLERSQDFGPIRSGAAGGVAGIAGKALGGQDLIREMTALANQRLDMYRRLDEAEKEANKRAEERIELEHKRGESERRAREEQARKVADIQRDTRTPVEELVQKFAELQGLPLDDNTRIRALEDLRRQTEDVGGFNVANRSIGAVHAGSVEALRAQFGPKTAEEKTLIEAKKTATQTQQANTLLSQIKKAIEDIPGFGGKD